MDDGFVVRRGVAYEGVHSLFGRLEVSLKDTRFRHFTAQLRSLAQLVEHAKIWVPLLFQDLLPQQ